MNGKVYFTTANIVRQGFAVGRVPNAGPLLYSSLNAPRNLGAVLLERNASGTWSPTQSHEGTAR
jgi:hypothetical protein